MSKVNLGCPVYCDGFLCVDIAPKDSRVVKMDAIEWLNQAGFDLEEIRSENLLEHLPNVQAFLKSCAGHLRLGGKVVVVTDNAEWLPFYLPFAIPKTGIGMHSVREASLKFNAVHLTIFSKMHLREHLILAGFHDVKVNRQWKVLGARLQGVGIK